ncbi:1-phosphatidylinositol phosphodiesterase-like [Mugil cephalus]|uniref:1-phosphatidylinositol phosphodiesterase-like n=1 Tax=Mugil cephalus TaxID=48193 RepID=UPI001FB72F9A|nr:1-phosphatidylinositol phosphodiesterase-like [Mugil cephalus]
MDWMKEIPDDTPISAISIPGTHESLTLYGPPLTKCQIWTLKQQLYVGIRYFDVHAGIWFPTEKLIYIRDSHWMYWQHMQFDEVLSDILKFLKDHNDETVLLKMTLHGLYKGKVVQLLNNLIGKHKKRIWTESSVPEMKKARNKVVFLWSDTFHVGIKNHESSLFIHNKLKNIEKGIKQMKSHICDHHIVLTDTTTSIFTNPKTLARKVNMELSNLVMQKKQISTQGCFGILSLNFPSADLIKNIIQLKPCDCEETTKTAPESQDSLPTPGTGQDSDQKSEPTSAPESPENVQHSQLTLATESPNSLPAPVTVQNSEPKPEPETPPHSPETGQDSEPKLEPDTSPESPENGPCTPTPSTCRRFRNKISTNTCTWIIYIPENFRAII